MSVQNSIFECPPNLLPVVRCVRNASNCAVNSTRVYDHIPPPCLIPSAYHRPSIPPEALVETRIASKLCSWTGRQHLQTNTRIRVPVTTSSGHACGEGRTSGGASWDWSGPPQFEIRYLGVRRLCSRGDDVLKVGNRHRGCAVNTHRVFDHTPPPSSLSGPRSMHTG